MASSAGPSTSPIQWVVDLLVDTGRRTRMLVRLAYLAALCGLSVTVIEDTFDPTGSSGTLGVALLGLSFFTFFLVSVLLMVPESGRG